jgi:thioredoxin-related protein
MKKLLIASFFTFIIATSMKPTDELQWMGFDEGYKLAQKKGKIMLVDVYTDWCGWCKRMDKDTYAKSEIISLINQDYVAIKFNPEINATYTFEGKKYTGEQLAGVLSNYQINGYPTTIFHSPKAKKTNVVGGYYDANRFKVLLQGVSKDFNIAAKK